MEAITVIEVPPQLVAGKKKKGTYRMIPELLMEVYTFIEEEKIPLVGPPVFICHETSPEAVKEANEKGTALVEVAWPVSGKVTGRGDIRVYTLPGGKMARAVHEGPYETCESTYLALFSWICEHNLQIAGPIREIYQNDPRTVKPEEILTEILVPVR